MAKKLLAAALLLTAIFCPVMAKAYLAYYYDPNTGTVAIDTANTTEGAVWSVGLGVNISLTDLRLIPENYVSITGTSYQTTKVDLIGESTMTAAIEGYFSIGEILPAGLDEFTWLNTFNSNYHVSRLNEAGYDYNVDPGFYAYLDCTPGTCNGGGLDGGADFYYGLPDRDFDNRVDLLNPDELTWANSASLLYDPTTGEVSIDTTGDLGGYISLFLLESEGAFLPENFTPFVDVPFQSSTPNLIGLAADAVEPGVYNLGAILDSGLTLEEVDSMITEARFLGRAGFAGGSLNLEGEGITFALAMTTSLPLMGDANGDGSVDLLDLDIVGTNFGKTPATYADGDFNDDNVVDLLDLDLMAPIYPFQGLGSVTSVPEPATILLLAPLAGSMLRRRS